MEVAKLLFAMTAVSVFCGIWFLTGSNIGIFLATVTVCGYLIMKMHAREVVEEGWLDGYDIQPVYVIAQMGTGGGIMCFHLHNLVYYDTEFKLDYVYYNLSPDARAMIADRALVYERPYSATYNQHFITTHLNQSEAARLPAMFRDSPVVFSDGVAAKIAIPKILGLKKNAKTGQYETANGDYEYNVETGTCKKIYGDIDPKVNVFNHLIEPKTEEDAKPTVK